MPITYIRSTALLLMRVMNGATGRRGAYRADGVRRRCGGRRVGWGGGGWIGRRGGRGVGWRGGRGSGGWRCEGGSGSWGGRCGGVDESGSWRHVGVGFGMLEHGVDEAVVHGGELVEVEPAVLGGVRGVELCVHQLRQESTSSVSRVAQPWPHCCRGTPPSVTTHTGKSHGVRSASCLQ